MALNDVLYLDTARLGQVSPGAERALQHTLELNKAAGGSMYFMDFLLGGFDQLQDKEKFNGLACWNGIEPLADEFQKLVFGSRKGKTYFASRSTVLVSLASQMLFRRCRNVLVSDLNWPAYDQILETSAPNDSCKVTRALVRKSVFEEGISDQDLVAQLLDVYVQNRCDGIFLPAVCNSGVKLPIARLIQEVKKVAPMRFVVIDAAQALNHVDLSWAAELADFTIAGTHKWLRAFAPMAVGLFAKTASISFIESTVKSELEKRPFLDPLLNFTLSSTSNFGETVNLSPLFAAAGAIEEAAIKVPSNTPTSISQILTDAGWHFQELPKTIRSNILLAKNERFDGSKAGHLSRLLIEFGVAVTDFGNGFCRFSLPESITEDEEAILRFALKQ